MGKRPFTVPSFIAIKWQPQLALCHCNGSQQIGQQDGQPASAARKVRRIALKQPPVGTA